MILNVNLSAGAGDLVAVGGGGGAVGINIIRPESFSENHFSPRFMLPCLLFIISRNFFFKIGIMKIAKNGEVSTDP